MLDGCTDLLQRSGNKRSALILEYLRNCLGDESETGHISAAVGGRTRFAARRPRRSRRLCGIGREGLTRDIAKPAIEQAGEGR